MSKRSTQVLLGAHGEVAHTPGAVQLSAWSYDSSCDSWPLSETKRPCQPSMQEQVNEGASATSLSTHPPPLAHGEDAHAAASSQAAPPQPWTHVHENCRSPPLNETLSHAPAFWHGELSQAGSRSHMPPPNPSTQTQVNALTCSPEDTQVPLVTHGAGWSELVQLPAF